VEGTADQLSSTMSAADQAFWEAALFEGFEQVSPVEAYPQAPDGGNVSFGSCFCGLVLLSPDKMSS
jgi:hypothetical protein